MRANPRPSFEALKSHFKNKCIIVSNNYYFFSIILRRLNKLYENIGSNKKFGKNNFGKLRKRYQEQQKTGTVMQGIDSPEELFNHTKMLIKGIAI